MGLRALGESSAHSASKITRAKIKRAGHRLVRQNRRAIGCLCLVLLTALALPLGCGPQPTQDTQITLPTTTMQIGGKQFVLEKATTEGEQQMGLMRRDSLAADHGMIFIFPQPQTQTFWNHDVRFPLDNLFLDPSGRIVSIQHMKAYDDTNTQPVVAQYVIELNLGTAQELGLKPGDALTLPADAVGR